MTPISSKENNVKRIVRLLNDDSCYSEMAVAAVEGFIKVIPEGLIF